jgi:5S rRNA maturation endonuclease (ribonuclease M5)
LKNLFVEGKSDREIIQWALSVIKPKGTTNSFTHLREASILDFSGISKLEDFLKASYEFMQNERPIIVLLDGDEAGLKSSRVLQGYFGQKNIKFSSNEEFILLPGGLPIEGLFPSDWLIELNKSNPNWFERFTCDLNEVIVDLKIKDGSKHSLQSALMRKADSETATKKHYAWAAAFLKLFKKIDELLAHKVQAISSS